MTKPSFGTQVTIITTVQKAVGASGVTSIAPAYLGRYPATGGHPSTVNNQDYWVIYGSSGSAIASGVWYNNSGSIERITTSSATVLQGKMVRAMEDIAWAEKNGYQTASAYGGFDTVFTAMGAVRAYIDELFANEAYIRNNLHVATSGTIITDNYTEDDAGFPTAGFKLPASDGVLRAAGAKLDIAEIRGVKWSSPQLLKNTNVPVGGYAIDVACIGRNKLACKYDSSTGSYIKTLEFNGDDWSFSGTALAMEPSGYAHYYTLPGSLCALSASQVASIDYFWASGTSLFYPLLNTYELNGTVWSIIGSPLVLSDQYLWKTCALSASVLTVVSYETPYSTFDGYISNFSWSGSVWSTVVSTYINDFELISVTALNDTTIAVLGTDSISYTQIATFRFDGSAWSEIGARATVFSGFQYTYNDLTSINNSEVVICDGIQGGLYVYRYSASTWSNVSSGELNIENGPCIIKALNGTDFVLVLNDEANQLFTYRLGYALATPFLVWE